MRANRNSELAQIHIAKKDLGLPDDEYRDLMKTICGVDSSSKLDATGRARFLAHLKKCGWKGGTGKSSKAHRPLSPKAKKVYSLWQQLHAAGHVRDRSFGALESWSKVQTGVDKLEWLNDAQLVQCIESLKSWLLRKPVAAQEKAGG